MKKMNLISLTVLSSLLCMNIASADNSCAYNSYESAVQQITDWNEGEKFLVALPGAGALGSLALGGETGVVPLIEIGAGLGVVAGVFSGTFYLIKKVEARHFQEVVNNLQGADGDPSDVKAVQHTADLINKKEHSHYSAIQVAQAINAAVAAGALCRADGTLAVTDNFRSIIETYLNVQQTVASVTPSDSQN